MSNSSIGYRLFFRWLAMATAFCCVLMCHTISTATSLAQTNQAFDIQLPERLFGTDASLALAGDGSVHVAFSPNAPLEFDVYPVQYAYCSASCDQKQNWSVATIDNVGHDGGGARMRLDAQGRPRMMWYIQCLS